MTKYCEMAKKLKIVILALFILIPAYFYAQVRIKTFYNNPQILNDSTFFDANNTSRIELLSEGWRVFSVSNQTQKNNTSLPAVYGSNEQVIFENSILFSENEIQKHTIKIGFLGLNYSADISLNNSTIYKWYGGDIPFEITLPKDLLKADSKNIIAVKINPALSSNSTIPVLQKFLFPVSQNGITREVYLKYQPVINFSKLSISTSLNNKTNGSVNLDFSITNFNALKHLYPEDQKISAGIIIKPKNFTGQTIAREINLTGFENPEFSSSTNFGLNSPALWSPDSPNIYTCTVNIYSSSEIILSAEREIVFLSLTNDSRLLLNYNPFTLKGTTYLINEAQLTGTDIYSRIYDDLELIKNTGFNAVRFSKLFPHPYALKVCQELGLLALIELPINSVPEEIISSDEFLLNAQNRFKELIDKYSRYSGAIIYGIGSGLLPNSPVTEDFISSIINSSKEYNIFSYASFNGIQNNSIEGLDLIGIEIFSRSTDDAKELLLSVDGPNYFLSEVTYPKYVGSANGYLVPHSEEAQAKFFENIINISGEKKFGGFFVNTLFNYNGNYNSLYGANPAGGGFSFSVLGKNRSTNSLPYKVLQSKLLGTEKVTIPIGSRKEENKLMFIVMALLLSVIMAIIINTKKKFREDCTRALFRPYNFYADIRDHRILSGIHTIILLIVEIGSAALFFTIFLYYLRTNIFLEKILLAFGNNSLINLVNTLAWQPEKSFIYIFAAIIIKIGLLTILIKVAAFSIKTRVDVTSIFYSIVWAFLPFTLLLPVELILYKILAAYGINIYALIFLLIFIMWILQRVIKGIHVIFDVRPLPVYFYSLIGILFISVVILLYFQLTNSTLYYLFNEIKQYTSTSY